MHLFRWLFSLFDEPSGKKTYFFINTTPWCILWIPKHGTNEILGCLLPYLNSNPATKNNPQIPQIFHFLTWIHHFPANAVAGSEPFSESIFTQDSENVPHMWYSGSNFFAKIHRLQATLKSWQIHIQTYTRPPVSWALTYWVRFTYGHAIALVFSSTPLDNKKTQNRNLLQVQTSFMPAPLTPPPIHTCVGPKTWLQCNKDCTVRP